MGSSLAITALVNGGYQIAIHVNTGELWTVGTYEDRNWQIGMWPRTSPDISGLTNGDYRIAVHSANGDPMCVDPMRGIEDHNQGMSPGGSPSITKLANGSYRIAVQLNYNSMLSTGPNYHKDLQLGMQPGTSPSFGD